ncbi:MAG: hypothetical protein C4329_14070 [Chitinophagaceae bacterium]
MKWILFAAIITLISCTNSEVKNKFGKADDLVIYFYSNAGSDSIYKIVHTSDEKAKEKLIGFIDGKNAERKCDVFTGKILFKAKGAIIDSVQFNTSDVACRIFSFLDGNKRKTVNMSNEAVDFLIALREDRKFY